MIAVTASVGAVRAVIDAAVRLGMRREDLLNILAEERIALDNADGRVSLRCLAAIDQAIDSRLGPGAAMRMGEALAAHDESIVAYLCRCAPTLRAFFEQISRYRALALDIAAPVLDIRGQRTWFGCVYPQELVEHLPHSIEREFASWLAAARRVTGRDCQPLELHLQTIATARANHEDFVRAPVRNGAAGCWLVVDTSLLDTPLINSDRALHAYLRPIADAALARIQKPASFAAGVRIEMRRLIREGSLSIEQVARALAISPRTLQRRLESEGTTFVELCDAMRRAAALEHLSDPRIPIKEAAFLTGFSEPSTFYRAFRRWTGATPAHYRRSLAT